MGKVSTSAKEAFDMGYLDRRAVIASNETTRLDQAKAEVLAMSRAGYRPPAPAKHIEVLGTEAIAAFETGIFMMREARLSPPSMTPSSASPSATSWPAAR